MQTTAESAGDFRPTPVSGFIHGTAEPANYFGSARPGAGANMEQGAARALGHHRGIVRFQTVNECWS